MVIALALAIQAASSSFEGKVIDDWSFSVTENGCSTGTSFSDKVNGQQSTLFFKYEAGANRLWVAFNHDKFKSLANGQTYEIELDLMINGKLDTGWGKTKYGAVHSAEDTGGRLFAKYNGKDMIADLRKASSIGFFLDEKPLVVFPLGNFAPVADALSQCGAIVEREKPIDPFAK